MRFKLRTRGYFKCYKYVNLAARAVLLLDTVNADT
jgi:hypothetical protein